MNKKKNILAEPHTVKKSGSKKGENHPMYDKPRPE
jgi:hypothetical protein